MIWLSNTSAVYSVILAVLFFGLIAGLVGSFALMRKMLLAGDVISHLALPGLGLALLLKINPIIGAATTLCVGTIMIWNIQQKTALATENVIGVMFAASLGIGAAVTASEGLMEALFGGFEHISLYTFLAGLIGGIIVLVGIWRLKERLVLALFSEDFGRCHRSQHEPPQSSFSPSLQPHGIDRAPIHGRCLRRL